MVRILETRILPDSRGIARHVKCSADILALRRRTVYRFVVN